MHTVWRKSGFHLIGITVLLSQISQVLYARNVGPQVDPGVFVITHIDSCRNGAGYCILGFTCEVDKDFTKDDLGGHCRGLSKAFNPRASFVCCRENPKAHAANKPPVTLQHIIDAGYSEAQSTIKSTSAEVSIISPSSTSIPVIPPLDLNASESMKFSDSAIPAATTSKDIDIPIFSIDESKIEVTSHTNPTHINVSSHTHDSITEIVMMASLDTEVGKFKEKEQMRPGIVLDGEPPLAKSSTKHKYMMKNESMNNGETSNRNDNTKPSINCFAAILLGIKCEINGIDSDIEKPQENLIAPPQTVTAEENHNNPNEKLPSEIVEEIEEGSDNDKIVTVKEGLVPDRDEAFLNKPLFQAPSVPMTLKMDKEESSTKPVLGQVSSLMDNIVNDTKTFVREENIPPAKPLSIMLTNHKINTGVTESTVLTDDSNLMGDLHSTSDTNMIASQEKLNWTNSNQIFLEQSSTIPSSEILSNLDSTKFYPIKDDIESSGLELEQHGENGNKFQPDLSKEPRIDKIQKPLLPKNENGQNPKFDVTDSSELSDGDKTIKTQPQLIPTFYTKKVQDGLYTSSNDASILTPSISITVLNNGSSIKNPIFQNNSGTLSNDALQGVATAPLAISPNDDNNSENENTLSISQNSKCGKIGGAAIFQVFGKLSQKLMPNLVANWVTGQNGQHQKDKQKRARLDISGEFDKEGTEPRIIAGDVTSTIMYCWMAAIVEVMPEDQGNKFICTGALVREDLVLTSASCTQRLFERGSHHFNVVLGDANLNIDLPFGVQNHEISEVIVHENYRPEDEYHHEDIGLIRLKANAKLQNTVCLLCLPERSKDYGGMNCTVTGYGKPSITALQEVKDSENENAVDATDGILRKAELPVVNKNQCRQYLDMNADKSDAFSGFLCAGGEGKEESCYVALDGGSPLACEVDGSGRYELAGLVTFGTSCSQDKSPSLFTNVSKYLRWIDENYKNTRKR